MIRNVRKFKSIIYFHGWNFALVQRRETHILQARIFSTDLFGKVVCKISWCASTGCFESPLKHNPSHIVQTWPNGLFVNLSVNSW